MIEFLPIYETEDMAQFNEKRLNFIILERILNDDDF
jgi:hypothetical protein